MATLQSFSDIHTNRFITAQPQKQALCDSAGVWLYSRNIHTSLLVPTLICQTAGVALLPVCSSNFFPIFLSHRLDWGWRRMLSRKAGRRPLAESVKQSQSPSLAQLGVDHSGFRHLWRPALFYCHCLGLWLCQSGYVHSDCT